VYVSWVR